MPAEQSFPDNYPIFEELLPTQSIEDRRFRVAFARTHDEIEAAQRLRFEVFNIELGEGLADSVQSGLDADRFDACCHHLLVSEKSTGKLVGTYRMQTAEMAQRHEGLYTADEFDLSLIPEEVLAKAVETGRACVARDYRNRMVLFLLWKGLATYMAWNRKRYLFGCCSLTSQDPAEGRRVMDHLEREGHLHPHLRTAPRSGWVCCPPEFEPDRADPQREVRLPKLFSLYLRLGAKVCGEPAIDRFFKTIDYLVMLDLEDLDSHSRALFFGSV